MTTEQQASATNKPDTTATENGLVVAHHGGQVLVEDNDGKTTPCHFRGKLTQLVVGDSVIFQPSPDNEPGIVTHLQPRRNLLERPDNYGNLKPVAANIDQLLITLAPEPVASSQLIDRYLVAAELATIPASLICNKMDLKSTKIKETVGIYRDLGYPVLESSATHTTGIDSLAEFIGTQTVAFVGQSGVGKSSLINALLPQANLATNTISARSGLGQHTTVAAQLLHLPSGGRVVDSPGIRQFGLWHINQTQLLQGYVELADLAGQCRFRNCRHQKEPGCALQDAARNGRIHPQRLANFFAIATTLSEKSRARY